MPGPSLSHTRARPAVGWAVRRLRELIDPITAGRTTAVPPRRLRARTGVPGVHEFALGGAQAAEELSAALAAAGGPGLHRFDAVLDFGCGSARVLPEIANRTGGSRRAGCDVDAAAIAWASARHPALELVNTAARPPLPFADGAFDLVYSISVFSHLDEPGQDAWLADLARVTQPGGIVLLSVHGAHAFERFRRGEVRTGWCDPAVFAGRAELGPGEFVFTPYLRTVWNQTDLPGVGAGYGLAFHGERYLTTRWGEHFEILHIAERALSDWQDVVVGRKPL